MNGTQPWKDPEHLWHTRGLATADRIVLQQQQIAALDRTITRLLAQPDLPMTYQRVEGWTTGEILAYMIARGLDEDRVRGSVPTEA